MGPTDRLNKLQVAFIEAYRNIGIISEAARVAEVDRSKHYKWMEDPLYAAAFNQAHADSLEAIEKEMRRRAVEGTFEPVFYKGQACYEVDPVTGEKRQLGLRRYSDTLLIFYAKGAMPDKYAERVKTESNSTVELTNELLERIAAGAIPNLQRADGTPIAPPPAQIEPPILDGDDDE